MNHEEPSDSFGAGGLGPALLRAGRDEWPSEQALSKTLAAISAGAAIVAVTGAAAGAGAGTSAVAKGGAVLVSFGSVVKWLGIGVVSGVVVAGVAHQVTAPAVAPREPSAVAPAPAVVPAPKREEPKPKAELAPTEAAPEPPKPAVLPHSELEPSGELERGVPLAAEVIVVDRARAALAGGNPAGALAELARYEATFPEQRLEPEVLFLRMEAHLGLGDTARARRTAEESIRRFPRSPHAARARSILDQGR